MASLTLSNPTTNTCTFKVTLSNPFNTTYYKKLRITKTNYGSSTSSVGSYLESRTASSTNTNSYYKSIVNTGLSAGRTYTLYAYAQAANETWYKAGSDTITMLDSEGSEGSEDLRIKSITAPDNLISGEAARFKVVVKNYGDKESDDYIVKVYDSDNNELAYDTEPGRDPGQTGNAYLKVTMNKSGSHRLKFKVDGSSDDIEYQTFTWISENEPNDIKLDVEFFSQYDNGLSRGCAVVTGALALQYHGSPVEPAEMYEYMKSIDANGNPNMQWDKAIEKSGLSNIVLVDSGSSNSISEDEVLEIIVNEIRDNNPVIVRIKHDKDGNGTHFVLAYGITNGGGTLSDILVVDSGRSKSAYDSFGEDKYTLQTAVDYWANKTGVTYSYVNRTIVYENKNV